MSTQPGYDAEAVWEILTETFRALLMYKHHTLRGEGPAPKQAAHIRERDALGIRFDVMIV
jgi:hypothetical protein